MLNLWSSRTIKIQTGCGSMYVTVARDPETREQKTIFVNLGKAGGCAAAQTETTARMVTLAVENGMKMTDIAEKLRGITCHQSMFHCKSCSDAIGQAIQRDEEEENKVNEA
jgi:ribonucleoside-diphosphate reductase alpha chain